MPENRYNDAANWAEMPGVSTFIWFYGDTAMLPGVVNIAGDQPLNYTQTTYPPSQGSVFVDGKGMPTSTFWIVIALLIVIAAVTWQK